MPKGDSNLWLLTTPQEVANRLTVIYHGAAWTEALIRYRTCRSPHDTDFYKEVLILLGAGDLIALEPSALKTAQAFAELLRDPAGVAAARAAEAAWEKDTERHAFWMDVLRELGPLMPAPDNDDGDHE